MQRHCEDSLGDIKYGDDKLRITKDLSTEKFCSAT